MTNDEKKPDLNKIETLVDAKLAKLHGPLAEKLKEQIENGDPLMRKVATLTAVILGTLVFAALTILLGLLLHKIYQAAHAHKTQIDAALGKVPGVGVALATGFDKLDDLNTKIDDKIQAKVKPIEDRLHQTALATPAPSQATSPAPVQAASPAPTQPTATTT